MEVWKKIEGFNDCYEASDLGRIRSSNKIHKNYILKQKLAKNGYMQVGMQNGSRITWRLVSRLVYQTFKGKTDLQIDHINEIKTDNRLVNLQALSHTDNNIKGKRHNKTSKYPGVHLYRGKKWKAQVGRNGVKIHLGYFENEEDAFNAYQKARAL